MIAMQPFSKHDWYGWAGAEAFPGGAEPLIGECTVVNRDGATVFATVIVDAQGVTVNLDDEEGVVDAVVYFAGAFGARALASIHDGVSRIELEAMPGAAVDTWRKEVAQ